MITILAVACALGSATGALLGTLWYYRLTDPHGVHARVRHLRVEIEVLHRAVSILESRLRAPPPHGNASLSPSHAPGGARRGSPMVYPSRPPSDVSTAPPGPLRGNTIDSEEGRPPRTGPVGRVRTVAPMLHDSGGYRRG